MASDADRLDWDDLKYFLRAVQSKSLAGAARAAGVDHSTIGRRLTALERSLGAPLVIRTADGLRLTPLGEQLAPLVAEVERSVLAVCRQAMQQPARVRLAMPTGFTTLFTAHLARLHAEQPQLALELLTGSGAADLRKGEADLALRIGPVHDEELIARRLGEAGWALYASPAYLARRPAAPDPADLSGHEVIGYDPSLSSVPAAQWIEQRAARATIVLRSREMSDMLAAASAGAGLAVLPCVLGDDAPGLERLTPNVVASRPVSLVYRRELRRVEPVRAVIRFVVDVMRDHADRVAGVRTEG